ncbi:hypothetical protein [Lysinibacillus xylanilyticus]|uniref:hypothetical protein n=1 Tax=Lysinibacillus xylanilyticus TaxID=582475 RepID=UPI003CFBD49E
MKKSVHYFLLFIAIICIGVIYQILLLEKEDYYTVIYNVANGILLSIIFYFIVDLFPQYRRKILGFKLIQMQYSNLLSEIENLLSITKQYYSLEGELKDLTLKEWSYIENKIETDVEEFILKRSKLKNKKCIIKNKISIPGGITSPTTLDKVAQSSLKNIEKYLNSIFLYESYFVEDTKFFMYLTQLRNSNLIELYTSKYTFNKMSNTYKDMYDLQNIYFGLKKYNIHYFESSSIIDTSEKALQYQEDFKSNTLMQNFIDFHSRKAEIYASTSRRVFYRNKKHSRFIADKMDKNFKLQRTLFDSIREVRIKDDLNIIIVNLLQSICLIFKDKNSEKLTFVILKSPIIGLIIKKTKYIRIFNKNFIVLPTSFKLFGRTFNKEDPSIENIGVITQTIDKHFNKEHNLNL